MPGFFNIPINNIRIFNVTSDPPPKIIGIVRLFSKVSINTKYPTANTANNNSISVNGQDGPIDKNGLLP